MSALKYRVDFFVPVADEISFYHYEEESHEDINKSEQSIPKAVLDAYREFDEDWTS